MENHVDKVTFIAVNFSDQLLNYIDFECNYVPFEHNKEANDDEIKIADKV